MRRAVEPWGSAMLGAAFHSDLMSRWTAQRSISFSTDHVYQRPFNETNDTAAVWDVPWKWFVMDDVQTVLDHQFLTSFFLFLISSPLGALCLILIIEQTVRLKGCHWTVYKEREHLGYNNNHHHSPPYFQTSLGKEDNIISPVQIKPYLYEALLNWLHWIIILTDHLTTGDWGRSDR